MIRCGYPFERNSDEGFRSQLDDIAKRHPEFAEHLSSFAQRDRQRSRDRQSPETSSTFPRRFPRQFGGSRFEGFGFPFDREDFDPEQFYHQQQAEPPSQTQSQQSHYQQQPKQYQSGAAEPSHVRAEAAASAAASTPAAPERERGNIQQSNTIDLGQKQEPINDRSKRSMSAPPSEKGKGFETNVKQTQQQPQPQPQTQQIPQQCNENMAQSNQKASNERIIPIHIEGRDEPVIPKHTAPSQSYTAPPPQQQQQHTTPPHPERIFGQRPEQFTQFLNRDSRYSPNSWHTGFDHPEEHIRQQRFMPQQNQPHAKEEIPIPVQREVPMQKKQQSQHQQQPPPQQPQQHHQQQQQQQQPQRDASPQPEQKATAAPPPQKSAPHSPLDQIQEIQKDVSALMAQVEAFSGKTKDKQYLYLDEMLTRNLIKLDNIDTQGQDAIRTARKEAIKCIEKAIGVLEAKAASGTDNAAKMDVEPAKEETQMETESQPMEVVPENAKEENKDVVMEEAKSESAAEQQVVSDEQQGSNMSVGEAVKLFESDKDVKMEESEKKNDAEDGKQHEDQNASEENKEVENAQGEENKNKEKKKGKKKVEKKEK